MRIASSALSELEVLLSSARSLATNFLLQKNLVEIIHPSDLLCDVHFMWKLNFHDKTLWSIPQIVYGRFTILVGLITEY